MSHAANVARAYPTEEQFQEQILKLARLNGWLAYHTRDSRKSEPGFPDIVAVRGHAGTARVLFAELKSHRGRLRPEQERWLNALRQCPGVEVAIWRPDDWPAILATLTRED